MTAASRAPRHTFASRAWPAAVAVILLASALSNVWVMVIAKRDPAFAVEPDYYRKAIAWDATMDQQQANVVLGWHAEADITGGDVASRAPFTLTVHLSDAGGAALDGAKVQVEAIPNARATQRETLALTPRGNGRYDGTLRAAVAGEWEVRVTAIREADTFTKALRVMAR